MNQREITIELVEEFMWASARINPRLHRAVLRADALGVLEEKVEVAWARMAVARHLRMGVFFELFGLEEIHVSRKLWERIPWRVH